MATPYTPQTKMATINDTLSIDILEEIVAILLSDTSIQTLATVRQQTRDTCQLWRLITNEAIYWKRIYISRRTKPDFLAWQLSQSSGIPLVIQIEGRVIPRPNDTTEIIRSVPDVNSMASMIDSCLVPEFHRVETLRAEAIHVEDWIALVGAISQCATNCLRDVEFTIGAINPPGMIRAHLAALSRGGPPPAGPYLPASKWHNVRSLKLKDLIPISGEWNGHANLTTLDISATHQVPKQTILTMLRATKRLRELVLEDVLFATDLDASTTPDVTGVTLHSVERLKFMNWGNQTWSILQHLKMPGLKVLSLTLMGAKTFEAVATTCGHLLNTVQYLQLKFVATPADGEAAIWKGLCDIKTIDITQSRLETWDSLEDYVASNREMWTELAEIRIRQYLTRKQASDILEREQVKSVVAWMTQEDGGPPQSMEMTKFERKGDKVGTTPKIAQDLWNETK
ncbi:hypothetical protein R3P38DRAFT_2783541 [Favolaschia claudopus]|uniref:F-box domain-containing protein n=1 Tax=Favolaschia claudopus TaxID=2862362 RepID=A0AAW0AZH5_9AGAR